MSADKYSHWYLPRFLLAFALVSCVCFGAGAQDRVQIAVRVFDETGQPITNTPVAVLPSLGRMPAATTDREGWVRITVPSQLYLTLRPAHRSYNRHQPMSISGGFSQTASMFPAPTGVFRASDPINEDVETLELLLQDLSLQIEIGAVSPSSVRQFLSDPWFRQSITAATTIKPGDDEVTRRWKEESRSMLTELLDELTRQPPQRRLGIMVRYDGRWPRVTNVTQNSLAARAGIQVNDYIFDVDSQPVGFNGLRTVEIGERLERVEAERVLLSVGPNPDNSRSVEVVFR